MDAIGVAFRVLGCTGKGLGEMVTLQGVVVEGGRFKGDYSKPILQVQKIDGRASQECIEVPIRPYATDFGKPYYVADLERPRKPDPERSLPQLEYGQTYDFRGYETGGFAGDTDEASSDGGVAKQRKGFYFTSEFVVVKGKKVPPITFAPADFLGQKVLLHGRAENNDGRAWLKGPGWEIEVLRGDVWSESVLGARIVVTGVVGREPGAQPLYIKECRVRRDHLEGQTDRRVELRGEARDMGGRWFLYCNGQNVLVENMDHLVAAGKFGFREVIEVRGVLRRERLRDEIFKPNSAELKDQYIVREAACSPTDDVLPIERVDEPCPWSVGGQ
jgi:hypothetical protein